MTFCSEEDGGRKRGTTGVEGTGEQTESIDFHCVSLGARVCLSVKSDGPHQLSGTRLSEGVTVCGRRR